MDGKISLSQWRALIAVVEAGGYAQAAEKLHKTQSTVTYAVQKLESLLGVKAFEIQGRKAVLSPTGQVLYRRARALVDEAEALERAAGSLAAGWEPELRLAVDIVFPTWLLLRCCGRLAEQRPEMRIDLLESVLDGAGEALLQGKADLIITGIVPPGFIGEHLLRARFLAVASPQHPLHQLGRPLTQQDLRRHRQIVIRDSALQRKRESGWLGSEQRWTVSHKATWIHAATMGLGFSWFPEDSIREELRNGELKPLLMREGADRYADMYLVFGDPDYAGPGARALAAMIREDVSGLCKSRGEPPPTTLPGQKPRRKR
ncbi:MAG: transcriptional regulator [Nevskia sp.]|nr:transcriptional regulator [Nevskia sp.]